MYAWITFVTERNEHGQPTASIKPGDEVTRQDLGASESDWEGLIESGSVRPQPYPKIPDNLSPAEHFRSQEGSRSRGQLTEEEVQERTTFQLPT